MASIEKGLLVLLGIEEDDTAADIEWMAGKTAVLRIFADEEGAWTQSVGEAGGDIIVVSQFTLMASTKKGTKPSWHRAARPELARPMCEAFVVELQKLVDRTVQTGRFGEMMEVGLVNDGPVTLILDSKKKE